MALNPDSCGDEKGDCALISRARYEDPSGHVLTWDPAAASALVIASKYGYHGHIGGSMRSTNIADLRNRLTQYLREVRAGEEIVVRDRQRPIAKIVPLTVDDESAEDTALVASGLMRKAARALPRSFWRARRAGLALATAVAAVSEDRDER